MSQTIARVEALSVAYPEPNDDHAMRYLTFAKITTSDGIVGWGEAVTMFPGVCRATEKLIESLADELVGRDPSETTAIWDELTSNAWWYGYRGGIFSFALSAVDIALWDIRGKTLGQPLIDLVGGAKQERLPAIASTHAFHGDLAVEVQRHAAYVRDEGYLGVKIGFGKRGDARLGYEIERDIRFIADLRAAVGEDAWIMVDRGKTLPWSLDDALTRVRAWEEQGLKWIEEPFEPEATADFQALRSETTCLFAGAEREWDMRGYTEAMADLTLDVIGCDVGRVGGVTGALRVIELVETRGKWFNSHAWSSAINTAVSVALSAATTTALVQELKPDRNPMQHEIVSNPIGIVDGHVDIPREPGNGASVDESVLEHYRLK